MRRKLDEGLQQTTMRALTGAVGDPASTWRGTHGATHTVRSDGVTIDSTATASATYVPLMRESILNPTVGRQREMRYRYCCI